MLKSVLLDLRPIKSLVVTREGSKIVFWRLSEEFRSFNSMSATNAKISSSPLPAGGLLQAPSPSRHGAVCLGVF
jgi:hypothetical protein